MPHHTRSYDVLLEDYEKGMTTARLDEIFAEVRACMGLHGPGDEAGVLVRCALPLPLCSWNMSLCSVPQSHVMHHTALCRCAPAWCP